MMYISAQQRFENRDSRLVLIKKFFENLANLAGLEGHLEEDYEITPVTAQIAATYLYLVESLVIGFKEERVTDTSGALAFIRDANKEARFGGLHDGERHLLRKVVEANFMHVEALPNGSIVRTDERPDWTFNLSGADIARAAAAALLGETLTA